MKRFFVLIVFFLNSVYAKAQVSVCSWNLQDFGSTMNDDQMAFVASIVNKFDVVAIQEVVAKDPGGAQAVARLAAQLNRKGSKWNYAVSDPTSGDSYKRERYAYLWKTNRLKLANKPWLEKNFESEIDREPYYATFIFENNRFTLANFHAITKERQPETEIKFFKYLPAEYPSENIIFCGDFNCISEHTVFNPLKSMGYKPALLQQKTSLKKQCISNDCLASAYDNVFYNSKKITQVSSGVIHFYKMLNWDEARKISDHIPVYFVFNLN